MLRGQIVQFPGTCGADVIAGLSTEVGAPEPLKSRTLQFASTSSENGESVITALKSLKFVQVLTWVNANGGRTCTLWVRGPHKLVAQAKKAIKGE